MQGARSRRSKADDWQQQGQWAGVVRDAYDQGNDLPWPEPMAGYLLVRPC